MYSYEFNETHRQEVVSNCVVQLPLVIFLKEQGFEVQSPGFIKGQSGIEQDFDIVANRDGKTYVFAIATDVREVAQDTVVKLFAKKFDIEAERSFVVAIPKMKQEGLKLAQLYGIDVIQGQDHTEIMEKMPQSLFSHAEHRVIRSNMEQSPTPPEHPTRGKSVETVESLTRQLTDEMRAQSQMTQKSVIRTHEETAPNGLLRTDAGKETVLVASVPGKSTSNLSISERETKSSESGRCENCDRLLIKGSKFCDQCGRLIG